MPHLDTFLNLTGIRRLPLTRQAEAAECGLACLAMIAGWHGYDTDLHSLRRQFPVSLKGVTLKELIEIAGAVSVKEPVYPVTVALGKTTVSAYGKEVPLLPGMALTADILLEERSFLRLLFDPLLAARGRVLGDG
jgi:hypothetical protein